MVPDRRDTTDVVTVFEPWSFVWWNPEWPLVTSDPDLDDGQPRTSFYDTNVDWGRVLSAVTDAVGQCRDAHDPFESERDVQLQQPVGRNDLKMVGKWLAPSDVAPRIGYLHDLQPGRGVENGRHRLWAARDHLADPYPLRGQYSWAFNGAQHMDSLIPIVAKSFRDELSWLRGRREHPQGKVNQHLEGMLVRCLDHLGLDTEVPALEPASEGELVDDPPVSVWGRIKRWFDAG